MPRKKINNRVRINLTVEATTYAELEKLAAQKGKGVTIPDVIREQIDRGLTTNYEVENIDLITRILQEQLSAMIVPAVERLAALNSKTCVQAATAAYLTAETINKFVPTQYQEDFNLVYEKAKKKGVAYTRNKGSVE